jgi:hypothetical protein
MEELEIRINEPPRLVVPPPPNKIPPLIMGPERTEFSTIISLAVIVPEVAPARVPKLVVVSSVLVL